MTQKLVYDDIIVTNGIKVPFVPEIITPVIERPMRNGRYETGECKALSDLLQAGDTVLELGAGLDYFRPLRPCPKASKKSSPSRQTRK